ncbi:hypothetical protein D3C73_1496040 [compost metagenome]
MPFFRNVNPVCVLDKALANVGRPESSNTRGAFDVVGRRLYDDAHADLRADILSEFLTPISWYHARPP